MFDYDYDDCPGCGRRDYGWELPDVRSTLHIPCGCEDAEEEGDCDCDLATIKVVIRRVFDRECDYCGGADYRCVWDVSLDGTVVKSFDSEDKADTYVSRTFPTAEAPERDEAWESEAWLRRAEGWG